MFRTAAWTGVVMATLSLGAGVRDEAPRVSERDHDSVISVAGSTLDGPPPTREERRPRAGAPYYIHKGPIGLCVERTDWSTLGPREISFDPNRRLISIWGDSEAETLVDIRVDDVGTTNAWDDELLVTMTVYADGPDVIVESPPEPLYEPGAGGSIDDLTTHNTPHELYYKKIEYRGDGEVRNAVSNGSPIPMYAQGHFADVGTAQGFAGGDAPECVRGSNYDDEIRTYGGSDWVMGRYGDDYIRGGDGDDTLEGGGGDDRLHGDRGADHLDDYAGDDCLDGGQDGRRDWLDDANTWDSDALIAEPGVLGGVSVPTIEYMTDEGAFLATSCG